MNGHDMITKMRFSQGFIAAFDQNGGPPPQTLRGYGIPDTEWQGEEESCARR